MTQNRQSSLQIYNTKLLTEETQNPLISKKHWCRQIVWVDWEIFFTAHFFLFFGLCDICLGGFFTLTFLGRRI